MKYGYFDNSNKEYVITDPSIPVSWTNYLGVKDLCTVISHNAGGYSFYKSAENCRITRFRPNGVPLDRPGHYIYIRDDISKKYWSVSWQPVGLDLKKAKYEVRHGLSYSKFKCSFDKIDATKTVFIPVDDDVEIWDVVIKNTDKKERKLNLFSYLEFSFKKVSLDNQDFQMSLYSSGSSYQDEIIQCDLFYNPSDYFYHTADFTPDSFDTIRDNFIGNYRTETNPIAVEQGKCSSECELAGNVCGSLQKHFILLPNQEKRFIFMVGYGNRGVAKKIRKKFSIFKNVDREFENLGKYWENKLSNFQCTTPDKGFDTMVNIWNPYQAHTTVQWSRFASFIEVGGRQGIGYRDTAQDLMSMIGINKQKCRQRLVELLEAQMSQGYGLHIFDPTLFSKNEKKETPSITVGFLPKKEDMLHGLDGACSDDALWVVASMVEYLKETGDFSFLDQIIPYADAGEATVYEHLKKILDFSLVHMGDNNICKGLRADWNDCLNLGQGESSMVSFILYWALIKFIELAKQMQMTKDIALYELKAKKVKKTCEKILWDGQWYIRGIAKTGSKIGTKDSSEGKIFLNAQSWAVFSGIATKKRAKECMNSVYENLFSKYGLHLLFPSYSRPDDAVGSLTRVYKGVKENGSIFSHSNSWAVIAEAILGNGERAMKYYNAISPYNQNDNIEFRQAEPYSFCQFVMGRDHTRHGRARHPWLTGSAGWFYTASTKYILGIKADFQGLRIDPCIPADWKKFLVRKVFQNAVYNIEVYNENGVSKGVKSITLNGKKIDGLIPKQASNSKNTIVVIMG